MLRFFPRLLVSAASLTFFLGAAPPTVDELKHPPAAAERHKSGLVSLELVKGTGERHPGKNDVAKVHFTAWTPEGEVFRTTRDKDPATFPLDKVFPGWSEGIQLMVVGETRRLWVPAHLGPPNPRSGPKEAIFDVELLEILDLPEPPTFDGKVDPAAERLSTGAHTLMLKPGKGGERPGPTGRVLLHYTLWDEKGRTLDSTSGRGRPTAFLLDRVMPAFAEVIEKMTVGEKRNIWIPAFAHQGQWPNGPKGMMIFEVELVRILPEGILQPQAEGGGSKP